MRYRHPSPDALPKDSERNHLALRLNLLSHIREFRFASFCADPAPVSPSDWSHFMLQPWPTNRTSPIAATTLIFIGLPIMIVPPSLE